MVSAFAFAWWLVALPHGAPPVAPGGAERPQPSQTQAQVPSLSAADAVGTEAGDEFGGPRSVLKVVTPEIIRVARTFLSLPMGEERFVRIDGHRYVFVLERHYHPPGFVGAPNGWHKGVTVYEVR